jgi:Fe-S cluster assembly protein SufD
MTTFRYDQRDVSETLILKEPGSYRVELAAEGVEVTIKGGWHARDTEDLEIRLDIVHLVGHTRSTTLLRGVAQDRSHILLSGTIIIEPGAQDTNAFLTENILLLSDQARAEAVPNLEISANEVKCSHAATVARIPEEHLFYLMSRGLSKEQAEGLIVEGFLAEAIE